MRTRLSCKELFDHVARTTINKLMRTQRAFKQEAPQKASPMKSKRTSETGDLPQVSLSDGLWDTDACHTPRECKRRFVRDAMTGRNIDRITCILCTTECLRPALREIVTSTKTARLEKEHNEHREKTQRKRKERRRTAPQVRPDSPMSITASPA